MSDATTMFDYKGEIFSGRELLAIEIGREIERNSIIKLLLDNYQERLSDGSRVPNNHNDSLDETVALIKDLKRNIASEILPDGSIYIEEIKGEQK